MTTRAFYFHHLLSSDLDWRLDKRTKSSPKYVPIQQSGREHLSYWIFYFFNVFLAFFVFLAEIKAVVVCEVMTSFVLKASCHGGKTKDCPCLLRLSWAEKKSKRSIVVLLLVIASGAPMIFLWDRLNNHTFLWATAICGMKRHRATQTVTVQVSYRKLGNNFKKVSS